jgi:hypothetical protein
MEPFLSEDKKKAKRRNRGFYIGVQSANFAHGFAWDSAIPHFLLRR